MVGERISPKRKAPPPDTWQIIYCSLMLILVAFFIMLVSYSTADKQKVMAFQSQFGQKRAAGGLINEQERPLQPREEIKAAAEKIEEAMRQGAWGEQITLERLPTGLKMTLEGEVLFPSGEATINEESKPFLNQVIHIVREGDFLIRISGHTDNVPIKTVQFPSNWELSTTRAVNVLRYFLEQGGISAERLSAQGFSQFRPRAANDTPDGRRLNRRIEIYFEIP